MYSNNTKTNTVNKNKVRRTKNKENKEKEKLNKVTNKINNLNQKLDSMTINTGDNKIARKLERKIQTNVRNRMNMNSGLSTMLTKLYSGQCDDLPNMMSVNVSPHVFNFSPNIPDVVTTTDKPSIGVILRPSLFRTMTTYSPVPSNIDFSPQNLYLKSLTGNWGFEAQANQQISLCCAYVVGSAEEGFNEILMNDINDPTFRRLNITNGRVSSGDRRLRCSFATNVQHEFTFNFTNYSITTFGWYLEVITYLNNQPQLTVTSQVSQAPTNTLSTASVIMPGGVGDYDSIGIYFVPIVTVNLNVGVESFGTFSDVVYPSSAILSREVSIIKDIQSGRILIDQFLQANSFRITSCLFIISNGTPNIGKGGYINAASMAGNSYQSVPLTDDLTGYISSRPDSKRLALSRGISYMWRPEKIQDLFFKPTDFTNREIVYGVNDLPYALLSIVPPLQTQGQPFPLSLQARIIMTVQYITEDISSLHIKLRGDEGGFLNALLSEWSKNEIFTDNPDHIQKIREFVLRTLKNPRVIQGFKDLTKFALTTGLSFL